MLKGKTVILGVCGGIPAYKACDAVRGLKKIGAEVWVVMTKNAREFVSPLTFATLSGNPVTTGMFNDSAGVPLPHLALRDKADLVLILPATANILAKAANGIADDVLSTLLVSVNCPVVFVPAMNPAMWSNPAVKKNAAAIKENGAIVVGPVSGKVVCGDEGLGKMAEISTVIDTVSDLLTIKKDLSGLSILITAGATREAIDPIRFISNLSSGKMGYALASAARKRGAEVTLISGHSAIAAPVSVKTIKVSSAEEMHEAVNQHRKNAQIIIMSAAIADYKPRFAFMQKLQKRSDSFSLELTKTIDILEELGKSKNGTFLVGFAAESTNLVENAREKLKKKNLDLIVANDVSAFEDDQSEITIVHREGRVETMPRQDKIIAAHKILDKIAEKALSFSAN